MTSLIRYYSPLDSVFDRAFGSFLPAVNGDAGVNARALKRTYDATPDPKLVVAVGDCGCTGGIFGESYASLGRVSNVIPVDVEIPGCPPPPTALLAGILAAITAAAPPAEPSLAPADEPQPAMRPPDDALRRGS